MTSLLLGGSEQEQMPDGTLKVPFRSPKEAALWLAYLGCLKLSQDEEARTACTEAYKVRFQKLRAEESAIPDTETVKPS